MTANIFRKVDRTKQREFMEFTSSSIHSTFFSLPEDNAFLTIEHKPEGSTCSVEINPKTERRSVYSGKDVDPLGILQVVEEQFISNRENFRTTGGISLVRGIPVQIWETCQFSKRLGAAIYIEAFYSTKSNNPTDQTSSSKSYIVQLRAEVREDNNDKAKLLIIISFYDYQSVIFQDTDFQIPEFLHCPSYRTEKKQVLPLPNYFSYQSEIVRYSTTSGLDAEVNHRAIHYDYRASLARVDFQGGTDSKDSLVRSFIVDFNSGLQYTFDPVFGTCSIEGLENSLDVFDKTKSNLVIEILKPDEFFHLNAIKDSPISYNGLYQTRGLPVNVFSRRISTMMSPGIIETREVFWYFTTDRTKLIEAEVEKNILVKMVSRPVTGSGHTGTGGAIDINFYNFVKEETTPFLFDVSSCYNNTLSKQFVMTFPGGYNNHLIENMQILKIQLQAVIQEVAEIGRQRVYIQQVDLQSPYLLAQFKILDLPPVQGSKPKSAESSLEKAVELIQKSITDKQFRVDVVTSSNTVIVLKPEPDSFKEFKADHPEESPIEFNESSFVGMAIGMAVLGFLLGGVVVNLIFTKKYGVSLLQATGAPAPAISFANPLTESKL